MLLITAPCLFFAVGRHIVTAKGRYRAEQHHCQQGDGIAYHLSFHTVLLFSCIECRKKKKKKRNE